MEQAFNDNNNFHDQRFRELLEALESLEKRVARLEEVVFNSRREPQSKWKPTSL